MSHSLQQNPNNISWCLGVITQSASVEKPCVSVSSISFKILQPESASAQKADDNILMCHQSASLSRSEFEVGTLSVVFKLWISPGKHEVEE